MSKLATEEMNNKSAVSEEEFVGGIRVRGVVRVLRGWNWFLLALVLLYA